MKIKNLTSAVQRGVSNRPRRTMLHRKFKILMKNCISRERAWLEISGYCIKLYESVFPTILNVPRNVRCRLSVANIVLWSNRPRCTSASYFLWSQRILRRRSKYRRVVHRFRSNRVVCFPYTCQTDQRNLLVMFGMEWRAFFTKHDKSLTSRGVVDAWETNRFIDSPILPLLHCTCRSFRW